MKEIERECELYASVSTTKSVLWDSKLPPVFDLFARRSIEHVSKSLLYSGVILLIKRNVLKKTCKIGHIKRFRFHPQSIYHIHFLDEFRLYLASTKISSN